MQAPPKKAECHHYHLHLDLPLYPLHFSEVFPLFCLDRASDEIDHVSSQSPRLLASHALASVSFRGAQVVLAGPALLPLRPWFSIFPLQLRRAQESFPELSRPGLPPQCPLSTLYLGLASSPCSFLLQTHLRHRLLQEALSDLPLLPFPHRVRALLWAPRPDPNRSGSSLSGVRSPCGGPGQSWCLLCLQCPQQCPQHRVRPD